MLKEKWFSNHSEWLFGCTRQTRPPHPHALDTHQFLTCLHDFLPGGLPLPTRASWHCPGQARIATTSWSRPQPTTDGSLHINPQLPCPLGRITLCFCFTVSPSFPHRIKFSATHNGSQITIGSLALNHAWHLLDTIFLGHQMSESNLRGSCQLGQQATSGPEREVTCSKPHRKSLSELKAESSSPGSLYYY